MATRKEIIDIQVQYGTLEGLESQLEQVNSELKQTQIGSDAFKSLTQEAQKLNAAIEGVNNQVAGITLEDKLFAADGAIKTFAGSVEATVGALGLLGIESEALGAFEEKAASAIALGMGLKDMAEGFGQVTQMAKKAQIATTLFGTATRKALIATGIGAFIVALGTIVAYWDEIKEAISGVSAEQKKLLADQEKSVQAAKDSLDAIGKSENILKLQGMTERQILQMRIDAVIKQIEGLELLQKEQILIQQTQIQTAKRNKEILQGIITFVSAPITSLLFAIDLAGKALGKDFGLERGFTEGLAKLVFDPEDVKLQGELSNKELEDQLLDAKNLLAGFKLQRNKIEKEGAGERVEIARQEKLEKSKEDEKESPPKIEPMKVEKVTPGDDSYRKNLFNRLGDYKQYTAEYVELTEEQAQAEQRAYLTTQEVTNARKDFHRDMAYAVADSIGQISQLMKEGSKGQKAFALSELAINTGIGFSNAYRIAQQSAIGTGPGAAFAMPLFYAQQVVTLLATINKARSILKGPAPSGASASSTTTPATISPTVPNIPQPMIVPTIKAYVLSGDVRNAQEADAKLSKRRTLG